MPYQVISSPYHLGSELSFDIVRGPHQRIRPLDRHSSVLAGELGETAVVCKAIKDVAGDIVSRGQAPLLWAGDCMAPIAIVAALQENNISPTIVWFDAHGDFNTPETSWTGYLAGMGLSMLAGLGDQSLLEDVGGEGVREEDIVLVDARHLDQKEAVLIADSQISHVEIDSLEFVLGKFSGPIYLHIDVDVINPKEMPAMLYEAPGGPSKAKVLDAASKIASTKNLCAMSVGITLDDGHPDIPKAISNAACLEEVMSSVKKKI